MVKMRKPILQMLPSVQKKYIKELQDYDVWETCQPPESWNPSGEYYYKFHGDGISLISYQSGFTGLQPFHVTTDTGDGWFRLSDIPAEQDNSAQQFGWMVYDTFGKWYSEARTADLYRSTSPPLTADELDELEAYTACQVSTYIEEWGGYTVSPRPLAASSPRYMMIPATWTQTHLSPTARA